MSRRKPRASSKIQIFTLLLHRGDAYHSWIVGKLKQQPPHTILPGIGKGGPLRIVCVAIQNGSHARALGRIARHRRNVQTYRNGSSGVKPFEVDGFTLSTFSKAE